MSSLLATGSSALLAFQRAMGTIGHNISNVSTPGYSRQRLELTTRPGQPHGSGFIGAGVHISSVQRLTDGFVFARGLDSTAEVGRLTRLSAMTSPLDATFSGSATGLASPWSSFLDAGQGVASEPTSTAARQEMLSRGNSLVARFRALDSQLDRAGHEAEQRLAGGIAEANRLSSEIADLNREIARQRGLSGGQPPNDLLDRRDQAAAELSQLVGVTTSVQDDGAMNVFTLGGQALVVGDTVSRLTLAADPYRPERSNVALESAAGPIGLPASALSGEVGGILSFRTTTLDSAAADLGRIAAGLAARFNAQHRQGMDAQGVMGGDFFAVPAPTMSAHAQNSGTATFATGIADPSALDGRNLVLRFDGAAWSATDAATGQSVALAGTGTSADPLRVGGTSIVVGGTPAANDSFLLQPTAQAAGRMAMAIDDPSRIAAASPLRSAAAGTNLGSARIDGPRVTDAGNAALLSPANIVFVDASNYTIDGSGPFPYTAGSTISANGWEVTVNGTPAAGDRFDIRPNAAGSSDNGNARRLAALGDESLFDGGSVSLNGAMSRLVTHVGSLARQAEFGLQGQQVLHAQISAERESVSGVNLDEEAGNLLRYQQAYQAAAQVIGVADEIFQTLISAVRR